MVNLIRINATGGPEVMQWESAELAEPKADEVQVRHTVIGLNFIDVYFRTGVYAAPQLPFTPGLEAAEKKKKA
ncbi:MAG: quinone oxidoreductase, partial [Gammaproteobacteria bacterium]|nr:quinone oxidoreductase [Gammaproteobacteria bacterium]